MTGALVAMALGGATAYTLTAPTGSFSDELTDPSCTATATNGFRLKSDGTWEIYTSGGGWAYAGDWISPITGFTASDYEVRVDDTSGTVSAGTVGSYQGLGSTREWNVSFTGCGDKSWAGTVTIRKTSGSPSNGPAAISLVAAVSG